MKTGIPGPVEIGANRLTGLTSGINGVQSVTNAIAFIPGTNRETDSELRARYFRNLGSLATGTLDALIAEVLQIDGVLSTRVEQNRESTVVEPRLDGVQIAANSVMTIITDKDNIPDIGQPQSPVDPDLEIMIAESISSALPPGISTSGESLVTLDNGQLIRYQRAEPIRIEIRYDIKTQAGFPADGIGTIAKRLVEFVENLSIGEGLPENILFAPLYEVPGHVVSSTSCSKASAVEIQCQRRQHKSNRRCSLQWHYLCA